MSNAELIECIENPLVREFLYEHLDEFADDVLVFSEQILAHVSPEDKRFVESAGVAFYTTPIIQFIPNLPWQTIKTSITKALSEVFQIQPNAHGHPERQITGTFEKDHTETGFIKQAIVSAFLSICKTTEDAMGIILIGGIAHLLGKYIALSTAGMIDDVIELKSWPVVQVPSTGHAKDISKD
jgi:hypothetical protein